MDAAEEDPAERGPLVVMLTGPRQVEVLRAPRPPVPPDHVRVRTVHSGISAGTERTLYRGTNPRPAEQVLPKAASTLRTAGAGRA